MTFIVRIRCRIERDGIFRNSGSIFLKKSVQLTNVSFAACSVRFSRGDQRALAPL